MNWEIDDQAGNTGSFTLEEDIVLRRTTDTISLFFSLDDHVDIKPYNYLPMYYGYRKRFLAYLYSFRRVGTSISIKANGERNIFRKDGNSIIEIPIDFPTDELNVVVNFRKYSEVNVEVFVRNGGISTLINQNSDECSVTNHKSKNGYLVSCKLKQPKFGHSYLILWHPEPEQLSFS